MEKAKRDVVVETSNRPRSFKLTGIVKAILKAIAALGCLYIFIISLDLLATSFRLLAGRNAGSVFRQSELLQNPIVGLMLGILATVLVQSSSTTTSIIVGVVASGVLKVEHAIPMVMGANIGTSVTNTIVSLTQISVAADFERAFACAVVHDFFNWLAVLVFLPIEVITGYIYHITEAIVNGITVSQGKEPPEILKAITKPVTKLFVQLDKKILKGWSLGDPKYENVTSLLKDCHPPEETVAELKPPLVTNGNFNDSVLDLHPKKSCYYVLSNTGIPDVWLGLILLIISLVVLCSCLIILVKILNSVMRDKMAELIRNYLNSDLPYVPWLTDYLAIVIGAIITFLVQSSSVFTSTLTPLVGTGVFKLERAYALTLGSNIGTTTTGMLAALAVDSSELRNSLQIALCHLFFNISAILLFFPIPFMRWPIPLSKMMGRTVAKYKWFAIFYLIFMFFLLPLYVFALSLLGSAVLYIGIIPVLIVLLIIILINIAQNRRPQMLPEKLKTWDFLPEPLRSLDPYDRILRKIACFNKCFSHDTENELELGN